MKTAVNNEEKDVRIYVTKDLKSSRQCVQAAQDRLKALELHSLERRRLRGDVIEMFKILTGKENIDYSQFFTLAPTLHNTRGHSL